MNDGAEIAFSWVAIFFAFLASLAIGLFIARTDELNTFHERVNPIVEEYGGSNSVKYNNSTNRNATEGTILNHMAKNSGLIHLHVDDIEPTNNGQNGPVGYGKQVTYHINMKVHTPLLNKTLAVNPRFQAVSKVGQD